MAHYIDADRLCAAIEEKYKSEIHPWLSGVSATSAIYDYVLPLIDSLQQELPEVDLEKEIDRFYGMYRKDGETFDLTDNENCVDWKIDCNPDFEIEFARHFYELGCRRTAEKYDEIEYNRQRAEESVPKDLEEAANNYLDGIYGKMPHSDYHIAIFIAGAQWQKEQTMKEAVNTVVSLDAGGFPFVEFGVSRFGLKVGDKVRVIVLPKEDRK